MATRKQRRRREKEFRHEYVWEDAEGNELEPDEVPAHKAGATPPKRASAPAGREPQPPSWRRTLKRGLIFAPIMFATVLLLSPKLSMSAKIGQTLFIVAIFVPFSYLLDGIFFRSAKKRQARHEQSNGRRGS